MSEKVLISIVGVDDRIARVEEMLSTQLERLQANQFLQVQSAYATNSLSSTERPLPPRRIGDVPVSPSRSELGIRVTPSISACSTTCPCMCHSRRISLTPAILNNVLGRLFVGYAGLPALGPKCDNENCQAAQTSRLNLEYWFPMSFWGKAIRVELAFHETMGPSMQMDTLRIIPDNAQCVTFAQAGNITGLKFLFDKGLASPRDISSTRRYSLLRWALYSKQYETCKFLMQAGADVDYKPIGTVDNSPRVKACHFLLEGNLSESIVEALRTITHGSDYLDDFIDDSRFTPTHKVVLGLSGRSLEEGLLLHPGEIDAQDAMGRTALAWAAARGDSRAIITLLRYGANPNIMDSQISGPLHKYLCQ